MALPNRHTPHLQNYDYSSCGFYFVTICTHNRQCLFGNIQNNTLVLSQLGEIAFSEMLNTQKIREEDAIYIEKFIIMPNHIHMLVFLSGTSGKVEQYNKFSKPIRNSLSTVVGGYKSAVTRKINSLCKADMASHVPTVWQSRYYEHIVRCEQSYLEIWQYIDSNTLTWENDKFYTL